MNDKISVIIIDDEIESIHLLSSLLSEIPEIGEVHWYSDSVSGFEKLNQIKPELVFLDLSMPNLSGIEILRLIRSLNLHVHIIVITSYKNKLLEAYKFDIVSYLLKPFDKIDVENAVKNYFDHKLIHGENSTLHGEVNSVNKIRISVGFETLFFAPEEIIYLEADGAYTQIYLLNDKKLTASYHLKKILDQIPQDKFIRISRKHVINLNYLSKIDKKAKKCMLNHQVKLTLLPYSRTEIES